MRPPLELMSPAELQRELARQERLVAATERKIATRAAEIAELAGKIAAREREMAEHAGRVAATERELARAVANYERNVAELRARRDERSLAWWLRWLVPLQTG